MENHTLNINTILHTKDGSKIGNAIVTGREGYFWEITTDYGNKVKFTSEEIDKLFNIAWFNYSKDNHDYDCQEMQDFMSSNHKHRVVTVGNEIIKINNMNLDITEKWAKEIALMSDADFELNCKHIETLLNIRKIALRQTECSRMFIIKRDTGKQLELLNYQDGYVELFLSQNEEGNSIILSKEELNNMFNWWLINCG